jgi:predicted nucleic acid-binding protein
MCDAEPVVPVYARICAKLQENAKVYRAIGQNDLWIAANAIHAGKPLVTRNRRHFEAVPELRLLVLAE